MLKYLYVLLHVGDLLLSLLDVALYLRFLRLQRLLVLLDKVNLEQIILLEAGQVFKQRLLIEVYVEVGIGLPKRLLARLRQLLLHLLLSEVFARLSCIDACHEETASCLLLWHFRRLRQTRLGRLPMLALVRLLALHPRRHRQLI